MIELNPTISYFFTFITLNVNSVYAPFKRTVIIRVDKKARLISTLFARERL